MPGRGLKSGDEQLRTIADIQDARPEPDESIAMPHGPQILGVLLIKGQHPELPDVSGRPEFGQDRGWNGLVETNTAQFLLYPHDLAKDLEPVEAEDGGLAEARKRRPAQLGSSRR